MNILEHWMMTHYFATFFTGLVLGIFVGALLRGLCEMGSDCEARYEHHISKVDEHAENLEEQGHETPR